MSSSLATQKATAKSVIDAYNAWDLDRIMAFRAPSCQSQVLPKSLGRPVQNNDEYRERLGVIMPWFSNFTATVHTEVHDVEARTCMMHASSTSDTVIGPYGNEYALVLKFSEDGSKVEKFEEFVDSGYSEKFFVRLAEAGKAKQGGGA